MDSIDLSQGQEAILQDSIVLELLPSELLEIIRLGDRFHFLDALAAASLFPALTLRVFTCFEQVFADTCARWISGPQHVRLAIIEASARVLRFAPHLSTYLEKYLRRTPQSLHRSGPIAYDFALPYLSNESLDKILELPVLDLQRLLLAVHRLLCFDRRAYAQAISTSKMQDLLQHENSAVRLLSVKILYLLLSASDAKLEEMTRRCVGISETVMGDFDGSEIDYRFLRLYEDKNTSYVEQIRKCFQNSVSSSSPLLPHDWSPLVSSFGNTLLPRPNGKPSRPSALVPTSTTLENVRVFANALLSDSPILVHGLSGSGKTSLVNDFARELGKDSKMVTLHLNEQTDAKVLIGMYATDTTPGAFTWQPGVLTTAIREGRWVFIEDLDRAPNEVISVILPLIEQGELLVPSRGETVRAAPGFRLIASIRTSANMSGEEISPAVHMLGARLWNRVAVKVPHLGEFVEIITGTHPILHRFIPGILAVYKRLYGLSQNPSFVSRGRATAGRPVSVRDLLKWCRRLEAVLVAAGSKTGEEAVSESVKDEMFMEAVDCFASSLQTEEARKSVILCIAEEMHIPMLRAEHYIEHHVPRYEENDSSLHIGRIKIPKRKRPGRATKQSKRLRPFANTAHAKRLLEQVGVALKMAEPVLLVGETGIGKTTVIQQLADSLGYKLTAVNLSQQSEVGDLLGGYKPVNVRSLAIPLKEEFDTLFSSTGLSATRNEKYLQQLGKHVAKGHWVRASKLWHEAPKMFEGILSEISKGEATRSKNVTEQPMKRRKMVSSLNSLLELKPRWERFSQKLDLFDIQLSGGSKGFAFTFVEGNIVKAVRDGEWVLLDEINLASPDTLETIADLLHSGPGGSPSILISETGDIERIQAHPNFRIFGAMNPATDVGKKDLPIGLRSRFTEIYVESPDRDVTDLLSVIKAYLGGSSTNDDRAAQDVARLYMKTKVLAEEKHLVDGANQVPHFSLRTLTRVLGYVTEIAPSYGLRRALYEGYAMGFLTLLNTESERLLMPLINQHLLGGHSNPQALLAQTPRHPEDNRQYVRFMNKKRDRQYWMLQGREIPQEQSHYIITPFVERNMLNLVRATSTRRFPVLVQGPTSSGKTSMIEYLANFSGNKFVRINNHEHTDLQEYLGTYVSGSDGQLRFQEGLLVQALREGYWIVLDELNLAPSDVLEALNRLLDDNRELLIPETQEIVRPHENFMLFATQNPPGLYGGRKILSRAFRNRFLELHFDDIPEDELEFILENRTRNVAPSDCRRIVTVYKELSRLRQSSRLFEQKDSFATLRDLFRWALRDADNREQLALNGYMLLAERVRKPEERKAVKEVIERVMKVLIDPTALYSAALSPEIRLYDSTTNIQGVVWNYAMRRLYVLVAHALRNNEPVLLVGETGCGKTTVCQMLAEAFQKELHVINAHQNTETGDLIGAQRPIRNRASTSKQLEVDLATVLDGGSYHAESDPRGLESLLSMYSGMSDDARSEIPDELRSRINSCQSRMKSLFEWSDGSLVQAMKEGQFFLLDEISLADDSVLERLNSVLETDRTLLLAEKGVEDSYVQAAAGFQFFATMNPGGDYGKRELSPALRNRFTEIWVPSITNHEDVYQIIEAKLTPSMRQLAKPMVEFADWFGFTYRSSAAQHFSVREILAWTTFVNSCKTSDPGFAILHGAAMVYIDTLGANPAAILAINPKSITEERTKCLQYLSVLWGHDITPIYYMPVNVMNTGSALSFGQFFIEKTAQAGTDLAFAFEAPTTKLNAMRVIRALKLQKPILIEGNPGVGKTTLIAALARAVGKPLTRINLSEQTDLMDLFGSDVPVEGAEAGNFAWRDAPFLQAMQNGDWVLLDEMNLASQSVLEGLNACLDHRGTVYISELDQTFSRHPNFTVFAAQNPHHQGGGRKGLPSSFVNRFTVVYADLFRNEDLALICKHNFPHIEDPVLSNIINFVSCLEQEVVYRHRFGSQGGPWEFNLRDSLRWLQLLASSEPFLLGSRPADFLNIVFRQRFRTAKDRQEVDKIFEKCFGIGVPFRHYFHDLSADGYQVGIAYLSRKQLTQRIPFPGASITARLPELESIMMCTTQNLPCILVGPSGSGKTTLIQHVAAATGAELVVFPLNADIDTIDLVGGFEQVDQQRAASGFLKAVCAFLESRILSSLPIAVPSEAVEILSLCQIAEINSVQSFARLQRLILALQNKSNLPEMDAFASTCQRFIDHPVQVGRARFEWVDGVLIKALQEGKWLILDNANLCSSAVLDRLNSLLEPNGFLSINEHCGPDGTPQLVKPHADFRLFLTMDPRFGELSRAMRNRAIEIYVGQVDQHSRLKIDSKSQPPSSEAFLQRYIRVVDTLRAPAPLDQGASLVGVALDHLSRGDLSSLRGFVDVVQSGLVDAVKPETFKVLRRYLQIIDTEEGQTSLQAGAEMYDLLQVEMNLPENFKDAQTIHPLHNSPLIPLINHFSSLEQCHWLGVIFEFQLEMFSASDAQKAQAEAMTALKPSQMNRLQRSLCRDRISSPSKDSTIGVAEFLSDSLIAIRSYLMGSITDGCNWKKHKKIISAIMQIWWETYKLASGSNFEDAVFQAHLALSKDILAAVSTGSMISNVQAIIPKTAAFSRESQDVVGLIRAQFHHYFDSGFNLSSGLSMDKLWRFFRPKPVSSMESLQILVEMERLATRFDDLKWKISISISDLSVLMNSLVDAYDLILTSAVDGHSLIKTLHREISNLEIETATEAEEAPPFFSVQFETLRQYEVLQNLSRTKSRLVALAGNSTQTLMHLKTATSNSIHLQRIDYLWGKGQDLFPIQDSFSAKLLQRVHMLGDVDLRSLSLLEAELSILGKEVGQASISLSRNQFSDMNGYLSQLMMRVVEIHGNNSSDHFKRFEQQLERIEGHTLESFNINFEYAFGRAEVDEPVATIPLHLQQVMTDHLKPALVAIIAAKLQSTSQIKHSSLAWTHFAIACITLYVPDRSFDPSIKQQLERQRYEHARKSLGTKITALRTFESMFTGQDTNLCCQLLEEEVHNMKEPAEIMQKVLRPDVSELDQLQGEFNNLLGSIVRVNPLETITSHFKIGSNETLQEINLLQNNVNQIVRRISERFRAYGDITMPVIGMLRCLQIGLYMATMAGIGLTSSAKDIEAISQITPFLGGTPHESDISIPDTSLDSLKYFSMMASVEGLEAFNASRRRSLLEVIHTCYENWSKRLGMDRKEAESKTGLYRFRGSIEDEEEDDQEEFNELFPDFDDEPFSSANSNTASIAARDTAVAIGNVHSKIFSGSSSPTESIMSLIREMSERIGSLQKDTTGIESGGMSVALLPGVITLVNDRVEALRSVSSVTDSYNFYTDPNLSETRTLVTLVHRIQGRFRELQDVDEISHMQPLEDVMVSCRELLQFRHTEPLAKVITKVEKIHAFMHEWQFGGWASRANMVVALYDDLTSTIVRWRRLELSTWAKLFDTEKNRCDDDAKSWWFVAYEVVIAAPLSIVESEQELKIYGQKLLQDLETYFATAVQGQFIARLQLLKQLQKHLEFLVSDVPLMSIILKAVANFTDFHSRYEKPIIENLKSGRLGLEKTMRDVLLLASWKDTNIVALRDSAKRSRHKLFKLVRKYRALLGQPMGQVLVQGLPDEAQDSDNRVAFGGRTSLPTVDRIAVALCESEVPNWSNKSKRLVSVSKTVALMDDACQIPASSVDGYDYLESFVTNIISSTAELQKGTPSVLTEENKDTVKHLKSMKRKLFADTLRELRRMGIRHNLGTTALGKQESLSVILATTGSLPKSGNEASKDLEYYFYKSLDSIVRARIATRQHSEDLSGGEVSRSAGLLEGLLQVVLKQRNGLSVAMVEAKTLKQVLKLAQALWDPKTYKIKNMNINSTHKDVLKWIPNILRVGSQLVKINSRLGGIDTTEIQNLLLSHTETFDLLSRDWQSLSDLPPDIDSTARQELKHRIDISIQSLGTDLSESRQKYPSVDFILRQILPWATTKAESELNRPRNEDVLPVDRALSNICDSILVAIKKFSQSITQLPDSTEDLAWLTKSDNCLYDSLSSLHVAQISTQISSIFETLKTVDLDSGNTGSVVGAMFAVALPILLQYSSIVQQNVLRCAQLHQATCKMTYILARTFTQIASQGFCTPSEKSNAQDGKQDKLEGGIGLGDGDGAEDVSKDIQDDEDLTELAQEPNKGDHQDLEDEKDAVEMADGDMEGETGEAEEKAEEEEENADREDSGSEIDEEAGDVNDLDPNAVDEKMWDSEGEKAEKDQEGDQSKGTASKDEQVAAQENETRAPGAEEDNDDADDEAGAEQSDEVKQDESEMHDRHAQDEEALELPEDMELDGNEQNIGLSDSDGGMDGLSDVNDDVKDGDEEVDQSKDNTPDGEDAEKKDRQDNLSDLDIADIDNQEENQGEDGTDVGEKGEDEQKPDVEDEDQRLLRDQSDYAMEGSNEAAPSDAQGSGEGQEENQEDDSTAPTNKAQREEGAKGEAQSEQQDVTSESGENGRQTNGEAPQNENNETQAASDAQPFKKLGDALERWHRQQSKIRDAPENHDKPPELSLDVDVDNTNFQHLQDEDAPADTQALGTATDEQSHALDESMAIDGRTEDLPDTFQPDEAEVDSTENDDTMDDDDVEKNHQEKNDAYDGRAGAMIRQSKLDQDRESDFQRTQESADDEEEIEEVDVQLSTTHIDDPSKLNFTRSASDARQLWTQYESITRDLSLSLTEQLRLILAPTLATKMRGDFRTGKRLNIKRIIPYIASQYKRDKIWMRRSVPSKRSYQIMLAVDDSKSMGESGSGSLAFETLVMVSKSLSMLEVGEICVVGFGQDVRVAHDFETPFTNEAGPKVFQNFGFGQNRTDVTKLVRESIELFRTARAKASSSPADLWQLELIISDGVCDSSEHEPIRRLLREAIEERIMVVFVIVDDVKGKKSGESVMDLKEAKFVKDDTTGVSNVKIERYLDTFPFQYYLVVSDVKELPGVLATLLRQWFAEVADSSG